MRAVMAFAAVLGGICWVVALWVDPLSAVGAVLLAVAVVGSGASLANRSATWLRVVAGVCFLGLVGSVLMMLRDAMNDEMVLAAAGTAAVVVGMMALTRRPAGVPRSRGSHAR